MEILDHIPVELDIKGLLRTLKIPNMKGEEMHPLVEKSRRLIEPRAAYTFVQVKKLEKDTVYLKSGHVFKSIILADMLKENQTIAPYVVTIGPRLENQASGEAKSSVLRAWVLEKMADHALGKASAYTKSRIMEKLGTAVSAFSPGTGTGKLFGIDQQETLFQILDPPSSIGVRLTPSYLMVPRKSVSGILAATPQEYVACQYCPREKCENRRKPFCGDYYAVNCKHEDS